MAAQTPAFCPRCGTPVTPGGRFCGSCGLDFTVAPASAPAMQLTSAPGGSPAISSINGPAIGMIGAGIVVILGSFLPWITATAAFVGTISRNGLDGGGDGFVSIIAGACIAIGGIARAVRSGSTKVAKGLGLLGALLGAAIGIIDFGTVNSRVVSSSTTGVIASVGTGLYVVLIGAAAGLLFSLLSSTADRK